MESARAAMGQRACQGLLECHLRRGAWLRESLGALRAYTHFKGGFKFVRRASREETEERDQEECGKMLHAESTSARGMVGLKGKPWPTPIGPVIGRHWASLASLMALLAPWARKRVRSYKFRGFSPVSWRTRRPTQCFPALSVVHVEDFKARMKVVDKWYAWHTCRGLHRYLLQWRYWGYLRTGSAGRAILIIYSEYY